MGSVIFDNIAVVIRNIEIRFAIPNNENLKIYWGYTLEELSFHTTDEDKNSKFFDRTKNEKAIIKLICLKNLGLYWNTKGT